MIDNGISKRFYNYEYRNNYVEKNIGVYFFISTLVSDSTVVKCCPWSGHLIIKGYTYFMTKPDAISATDKFYFHECYLLITK